MILVKVDFLEATLVGLALAAVIFVAMRTLISRCAAELCSRCQ